MYNHKKYNNIHLLERKMNRFAYQERIPRGTFDLPIEFHHVDRTHPRYQMPFHWHIEYEFLLVLKGQMSCF